MRLDRKHLQLRLIDISSIVKLIFNLQTFQSVASIQSTVLIHSSNL